MTRSLRLALQGQGFGGEGVGRDDGAGAIVMQDMSAIGEQEPIYGLTPCTLKGGRASSRAQTTPANMEKQGSRGRSPSQVGERESSASADLAELEKRAARLRDFDRRLTAAGLGASYEAEHARLAADCVATARQRRELIKNGKIKPLPQTRETAADRCYVESATKLCDGFEAVLKNYENASDPQKRQAYELWVRAAE